MAYGFNDDRSKVEVYSEDEIDSQLLEKAHCFETVADMKDATSLKAGMICHTNGFHVSGDGGAAWYEISDTGTANEMDVIECDELFATLILPEKLYPEIVGAWGDGVHDDTQFVKRALEISYDTGNRAIYLRKNHLITETIIIAFANCNIIGEKSAFNYLNMITFRPETSIPLFEINNTGFCVDGVSIKCYEKNTQVASPSISNGYTCFYYNPTNIIGGNENVDTFIGNCAFSNFNYVFVAVGQNYVVKNNLFSGCQFVFWMETTNVNSRNWHIEGNRFHLIGADFSLSQCFRVTQGNPATLNMLHALVIKDNIFDFCKEIYLGSSNFVFCENYIRNPVLTTNPLIRVINLSTYKTESYKHETVFSNNVYINTRTENVQKVLLRIEQVNGITIENNHVQFTEANAFELVNSSNVNVSGNIIYSGSVGNSCLTCVNVTNGIINGNNCISGKTYAGIENTEGVNYSNLISV